jgi:hypothetical protein
MQTSEMRVTDTECDSGWRQQVALERGQALKSFEVLQQKTQQFRPRVWYYFFTRRTDNVISK